MRIRAILSAVGAVLAAAALAVAPLSATHAADTWGQTGVSLPGYYQMAVDAVHDHVFISEGGDGTFHNIGYSGANDILVTDFSGNTVATITGQTGVMGIALSPDGSTLYAALSTIHEVTAISTATLQQTAVYPLDYGITPYMVAVQSGKLWVSYYTGSADDAGAIGDFDLSAPTVPAPALETQAAMGGWGAAPIIAADPADTGNVLVAIDPYTDTPEAATYDTAADPVTVRAARSALTLPDGSAGCQYAQDLVVIPGGAQFAPACDNDVNAVGRYSTANLSHQGSYASGLNSDSVAFASKTGLVAAGDKTAGNNIDLSVPGGIAKLGGRSTPGSGYVVARGLGLTPDGSKLFAVTNDNGVSTLYTMDEPAINPSALSLTAPASALPGQFALLSGKLGADNDTAVANAAITITRTGPGGTETLTATTNASGFFGRDDVPTISGTYTYTARYAGSPSIAPAVATAHLTVKKVPPLSISVTPKTATYPAVMHVSIHLGTTDSDRTVSVYAKPAGAAKLTLLKTGTVNSAGNLTLSYAAAHTTTFSVRFTGDFSYAPRTVTAGASVAAAVSTKISGYYAGERIAAVTYHLYHHTAQLSAAVAVAPNKHGECVKLEVQEFSKGQWRASHVTGCAKLGTKSTAGARLALSGDALGAHYRLRADYLHGTDLTNLSAESAWQYFIVEK